MLISIIIMRFVTHFRYSDEEILPESDRRTDPMYIKWKKEIEEIDAKEAAEKELAEAGEGQENVANK